MTDPSMPKALRRAIDRFTEEPRQVHTRIGMVSVVAAVAERMDELEAIVEKLPGRVADRLFVSEGPHAEVNRLVMETRHQKLDGPGWCKTAVADQVRKAMAAAETAVKEGATTP